MTSPEEQDWEYVPKSEYHEIEAFYLHNHGGNRKLIRAHSELVSISRIELSPYIQSIFYKGYADAKEISKPAAALLTMQAYAVWDPPDALYSYEAKTLLAKLTNKRGEVLVPAWAITAIAKASIQYLEYGDSELQTFFQLPSKSHGAKKMGMPREDLSTLEKVAENVVKASKTGRPISDGEAIRMVIEDGTKDGDKDSVPGMSEKWIELSLRRVRKILAQTGLLYRPKKRQ